MAFGAKKYKVHRDGMWGAQTKKSDPNKGKQDRKVGKNGDATGGIKPWTGTRRFV